MSRDTPIPNQSSAQNSDHMQTFALATLAGGCFWCLEPAFMELKGVHDIEVGYAGSAHTPATYETVCSGKTGLAEVVHIQFDPSLIDYSTLLKIFFILHDPTTLNRQGNDVGTQYRSAIFTHDETQAHTAHELKNWVEHAIEQPVVTEITPFIREHYTRAEDEHQEYFEHNPDNGYCQMLIPNKLSKLRANFAGYLK